MAVLAVVVLAEIQMLHTREPQALLIPEAAAEAAATEQVLRQQVAQAAPASSFSNTLSPSNLS
jgi:hypothetical protein